MTGRAPAHAVVAAVACAYAGFGLFVGGGYDPGRDVAVAYSIVHDGARPLLGPLIAGSVHLGPLWYYLLALPMTVVPTWLAAAMTAVIVGALQFPLAYAAGKRIGDRSLGLLWVAALAMPGFASFETVGFASTNAVRTGVIAALYCVLRARDTPGTGWWFAAGLAASCVTHAHPSCVWVAVIVCVRALLSPAVASTLLRERVVATLAAFAGFALPFVPALFAPVSLLEASRQVASANIGTANFARAPALLWSVAWTGPHAIMAAVFAAGNTLSANVATVAALLGIAGALRGVAAALGRDRAARWGVLMLVTATLFVALVRPVTPVYMTYSIVPGYALLVASGWRRFSDSRPLALFIVPALCAAAIAGFGIVHSMREGGGRIDIASLADVTHAPSPSATATDIWLYAASVDPLGAALCADPAPVYAALAYALDVFYAMPLRLHCADRLRRFTDERATGPSSTRGRLGLALRRYQDLGAVPSLRVGGLGIDRVARIVAVPQQRDLPLDTRYPPHAYLAGAATHVQYGFDATASEFVVVSNPRVTWMPAWDARVQCNGTAVGAASADLVTRIYRCAGNGSNRWTVDVAAVDPHALEVVTFAPRMR